MEENYVFDIAHCGPINQSQQYVLILWRGIYKFYIQYFIPPNERDWSSIIDMKILYVLTLPLVWLQPTLEGRPRTSRRARPSIDSQYIFYQVIGYCFVVRDDTLFLIISNAFA